MNEIVEMIYHWHQGGGVKGISHSLGFDRDTVRKYIKYMRMAPKMGIERSTPFPELGEVISRLKALMDSTPQRKTPAKDLIHLHRD